MGPLLKHATPAIISELKDIGKGKGAFCAVSLVFTHWLYGNNSIALRSSRIVLWV